MQILNLQPVTGELVTCNTRVNSFARVYKFRIFALVKIIEGFILHDDI